MKIAYIFAMPRTASYKLGKMILLQLEPDFLTAPFTPEQVNDFKAGKLPTGTL